MLFTSQKSKTPLKQTLGWRFRKPIQNMAALPFDNCDGWRMKRFLRMNEHLQVNPLDAYTHLHDFGNPECDRRDETIVFLHFQKTAGSTFNQVLRRNVPLVGFRHGSAPKRPYPGGRTVLEIFRSLPKKEQLLEQQKWGVYDAFSGHSIYGIHELLPEERRFHYITFLRDPIDRLLSYYRFIRRREEQSLHGQRGRSLTFLEFLEDPFFSWVYGRQESYMTLLSGFSGRTTMFAEEQLARAKENIASFKAVFFTEDFEKAMQDVCSLYGWKDEIRTPDGKNIPRGDFREGTVTGSANARDQLTEEELEGALEYTKFEREIYDAAKLTFGS